MQKREHEIKEGKSRLGRVGGGNEVRERTEGRGVLGTGEQLRAISGGTDKCVCCTHCGVFNSNEKATPLFCTAPGMNLAD